MSTAIVHIRTSGAQNAGSARLSLDLQVATGERISLVGPNGSGKTTLLRTLLGFRKSDNLNITISGHFSRSKAYVPQDYRKALFPWLTLQRNLALSDHSAHKLSKLKHDFDYLAERLRLSINLQKYPYQVSGGEQQLFVLIRALILEPSLLVLDEPLSAVDYARRLIAQEILSEYCTQANCTCFLATHDFEEAVFLADKVVVINGLAGTSRILKVCEPWPRAESFRSSASFGLILHDITGEVL